MVISVKILLSFIACFLLITTASGDDFSVINTDNADLAFREILIEKSMHGDKFNCSVTRDTLPAALKKLSENKCDIVLVKKEVQELKNLPKNIECMKFAETSFIIFVHKDNQLKKLKLSELKKIWNEDINSWQTFKPENFFSIHRFGMRLNDSSFVFLKNHLQLKENVNHFPLDSAQQIITMTASNPNAIGIAVFEKDLDFKGINLIQLIDDNGKNITLNMPHTIIYRRNDREKITAFIKRRKK